LEGSGKEASLVAGAQLGGSFLGIRKDMGRRAQTMDITGNSDKSNGALEMGHLSPLELC